jgi:hypothetical protein
MVGLQGCGRAAIPVRFIIPDGYRGEVIIYYDEPAGNELPTADGVLVVQVPGSGILHIKDKGPFFSAHTVTASYASGQDLPYGFGAGSVGDDMVAFRDLGSGVRDHVRYVHYFVGTKKEMEGKLANGMKADTSTNNRTSRR